MKSTKQFRPNNPSGDKDDFSRKSVKLTPIKKSGKDKHFIYGEFEQDDETEDLIGTYRKRESVYDYFDDLQDVDGMEKDELVDLLEDEWEDNRDDGDYEEFPLDEDDTSIEE